MLQYKHNVIFMLKIIKYTISISLLIFVLFYSIFFLHGKWVFKSCRKEITVGQIIQFLTSNFIISETSIVFKDGIITKFVISTLPAVEYFKITDTEIDIKYTCGGEGVFLLKTFQ